MKEWGFLPGPNGEDCPQVEFMLTRSAGRLRAGHIYAETERVLIEMADERGNETLFELTEIDRSSMTAAWLAPQCLTLPLVDIASVR